MNNRTVTLALCNNLLVGLVGADKVHTWWHSANRHFNGLTPAKHWELAPQEVYNYLLMHGGADYL